MHSEKLVAGVHPGAAGMALDWIVCCRTQLSTREPLMPLSVAKREQVALGWGQFIKGWDQEGQKTLVVTG